VWSMSAQAGGVTTVVLEKFDPEGCLDAIQRHRVTHAQFVPTHFTRMLKLPDSVRNRTGLIRAGAYISMHAYGALSDIWRFSRT